MRTVKELSQLAGISVRTLHHYDTIGLLKPSQVTPAGYRLYDDAALERLSLILLYRELNFSLKEIGALLVMSEPARSQMLQDRIELLETQRQKLQDHIFLAKQLKQTGVSHLNIEKVNAKNLAEREAQARILWGNTDAYREYEEKTKEQSAEERSAVNAQLMDYFVRLGTMVDKTPDHPSVQAWVSDLQQYLTAHYYRCTPQILRGLGQMYAGGGSMTENIDHAGGTGTAALAHQAIEYYCDHI